MTGTSFDAEFEEFERSQERVRCLTCQMDDADLRTFIEGRWKTGASMNKLASFLNLKGHRIGVGALKGHLQNHVA
jgi:hypothetical protein